MSRVIVYPYKMGSKSGRELARALGALRVYPDRNYHPRNDDVVVNWGNSTAPQWIWPNVNKFLNGTNAVHRAANKLLTFEALRDMEVPHPEYTTDQSEAQRWVDNRETVVERHRLTGHSGQGVAIKSFGEDVSPSPLYVKYIKKKQEFRVHVFNGEVIDIQEKRKRQEMDREEVDFKIRSYQNGWVFCRQDIRRPDNLREISVRAIRALGLDFGAVDVIYNEHHNQCYVLEVNTACGLEGSTIDSYVRAINDYINR